jgi:isoquinoline 1-oxidoreductase beta subunit
MKRRLLLSGAAAGGALLIGWGLLPPRSRLGGRDVLPVTGGEVALNGWLKIAPDGGVTLAMPRVEMGQGAHTALAMLVAEELDFPLDRLKLGEAGPEAIYGNVAYLVGALPIHPKDREPGQESVLWRAGSWTVAKLARELGLSFTGGSSSVADAWEPLREAAATARAQLVGAASLRWRLPKDEIVVRDGTLEHAAAGQRAHFGEFAAAAAATPAGEVRSKPRNAWTLIGHAAPRTDLLSKVTGAAVYGIDVRPDGLVFAAVRMAPALGGAPQRVLNEDEVLRRPGVERLVRLPPAAGSTAGVAIVGRSSWHARQAAEALQIDWASPSAGTAESAAIADMLAATAKHALDRHEGLAFHTRGDVDAAERDTVPGRVLEAAYRTPYLAHAALEPINATAQVKDGRVSVWLSTQAPTMARQIAARAAGVREEAVTLHATLVGGGFGRRLEVEVVAQAVVVAQETGGRPVQVLWSREEDFTHDVYRPAAAATLRAGLDDAGRVHWLRVGSAGDAIAPRWLARNLPQLTGPVDPPDKTVAEGLSDQAYGIAHQRIAHVATKSGVPVGFWRSVGHSHNAFFMESFIDELAHAAGRDPLAFRLAMLENAPRHAAVLKRAADQAGWGTPLAPGRAGPDVPGERRARGLALHESFGSIVAQMVEVSLGADRRVRVHRVVCVADCGTVVNPGIAAQQIEGGVMFALAAALHGRIDIAASVVRAKNFPDQPLLTLADTPAIEVHFVRSTRPPAGVGEIAVPPLAPAVANAVFALTGNRLRELPLKLA